MLKTKPAVITDVGIDMQLRNLNGETIEFTKLVVGDGVYSESESDPELLRKMVSLKSPKQQFGVSSISMVDNEKIVASTVITNYELEEGYTIRELGLYARIKDDPESEGLVSLSLAEIEDTFPAYDGKVVSRIISRFQFSVSDSDTVQLSYLHDPVALVEDVDAKIAVLQKAIDDATALKASLESYGMVKLTDSAAVTDSTGLALPATEKNASIDGTLAAQIASLNTEKGLISGEIDFDSLLTPGCYTVEYCANTPLNEYQWGNLIVYNSGSYAKTQIYIPHVPFKYAIVIRLIFDNEGVAWKGIIFQTDQV